MGGHSNMNMEKNTVLWNRSVCLRVSLWCLSKENKEEKGKTGMNTQKSTVIKK